MIIVEGYEMVDTSNPHKYEWRKVEFIPDNILPSSIKIFNSSDAVLPSTNPTNRPNSTVSVSESTYVVPDEVERLIQ